MSRMSSGARIGPFRADILHWPADLQRALPDGEFPMHTEHLLGIAHEFVVSLGKTPGSYVWPLVVRYGPVVAAPSRDRRRTTCTLADR